MENSATSATCERICELGCQTIYGTSCKRNATRYEISIPIPPMQYKTNEHLAAHSKMPRRHHKGKSFEIFIHACHIHRHLTAAPSSIYSWSICHILEHEFFFQGRFGSLARQGSSSLIFDFQLPNSYPNTIPFLVKKCFKNNRKNNINQSCNFCY